MAPQTHPLQTIFLLSGEDFGKRSARNLVKTNLTFSRLRQEIFSRSAKINPCDAISFVFSPTIVILRNRKTCAGIAKTDTIPMIKNQKVRFGIFSSMKVGAEDKIAAHMKEEKIEEIAM